jgi:hypothetical protein
MNKLVAFKITIILLLLIFLQDGFIVQIDTLLRSENPVRNMFVFLVVWSTSVVSLIVVSLIENKFIRVFWGGVFSLSLFSYLTFVQIMGYAPTFVDAKVLFIETGQINAAVLTYWSELIIPLILSAIFFNVVVFPAKSSSLFKKSWVSILTIPFPLIPLMMISGMLVLKGGGAAVGMLGGMFLPASYFASISYESITQKDTPRKEVNLTANIPLIKNIILIVDESISGDFISLDTQKSITPVLIKNRELINDFGIASSAHNCSSYSNATLRWGITPSNIKQALSLPTIWQYAKLSGYKTTYIDSQKQPGTYGNFMDINEASHIDNFT